jgi:hypothetical protein
MVLLMVGGSLHPRTGATEMVFDVLAVGYETEVQLPSLSLI